MPALAPALESATFPGTMATPRIRPAAAKPKGRPRSAVPRDKQIQIRASQEEEATWLRIVAARSEATGIALSQQQVFRWILADVSARICS